MSRNSNGTKPMLTLRTAPEKAAAYVAVLEEAEEEEYAYIEKMREANGDAAYKAM